jgi:hypothetical protein
VRAVNRSALKSEWRPVETTFLELAALAPDGSHDTGVPVIFQGTPQRDHSFFTTAIGIEAETGSLQLGKIAVGARARAADEADTVYDTALMQNIGGITNWEVMTGYWPSDNRAAVTSISATTPAVVTTPAVHGLSPGDWVVIDHDGAIPPPNELKSANGIWQVLATPTTTTFSLVDSNPDNTVTAGNITFGEVLVRVDRFPSNRSQDNYSYDGGGFWVLTNKMFLIDFPNMGVQGVSLRAENYYGVSKWYRIGGDYFGSARPPMWTGAGSVKPVENPGLTVSDTNFDPNIAKARAYELVPGVDLTIGPSNNKDFDGTQVFAVQNGQDLTIIITQPSSGLPFTVTWNSIYKGASMYPPSMILGESSVYNFLVISPSRIVLVGVPVIGIAP